MKSSYGFTIVELLIVIVVIALLASISLATYNGIQTRAYDAKAISIVKSYETALEIYRVQHNNYPTYANSGAGDAWVCLGSLEDYPAADGFAAGECEQWGTKLVTIDANFSNELRSVMGKSVSGALPVVDYGAGRARGVQYYAFMNSLDYYMKGTEACPRGIKEAPNGNTRCVVKLGG